MSDLISRSQLLKEIETWGGCVEALHEYIQKMPTAYDPDKVVEELKSLQTYNMGLATLMSDLQRNGVCRHYVYLEDVIEIVKQGSVTDDVCEWEKGSSGYVGYPAYYSKCCTTNSNGLEMQTHIISDWKYCPYCGKKIKIVGDLYVKH